MDLRKSEQPFTVGYRSFPEMVKLEEVSRPKHRCPKCGGYLEVVEYTSINKKTGQVNTTPEGDCMQCGFHVWNMNFKTGSNDSGVAPWTLEDAKYVKDPVVTPEGLEALEIVTKVQKPKRVSQVVKKEGMSIMDRLLKGL